MDAHAYEQIFKALADKNRLKIITLLTQESVCACKLLTHFSFSQPALSQHMKILINSGFVRSWRVGNWTHYALVSETFDAIKDLLDNLKPMMEEKSMSKKWYPVINETTCTQCGTCVKKCSNGVYDKASKMTPIIVAPEACIQGCHGCGNICPTGAINYFGDVTGWKPPFAAKNS